MCGSQSVVPEIRRGSLLGFPALFLFRLALVALTVLICFCGASGTGQADRQVSFTTVIPIDRPEYAFDLAAVCDTSLWFTTNQGVYHWDGLVLQKQLDAAGFARDMVEVFLVEALSDSDVWVLGHDAATWAKTLMHFDGQHWERMPFPQAGADTGSDLIIFRFRIAKDRSGYYGVAVGSDGTCFFYDGRSWTLQTGFTTQSLRTVELLGRTDIWTAGRGGALFHYDGSAWSQSVVEPEGHQDTFLELSFHTATDGWGVSAGSILRYYNGHWRVLEKEQGTAARTVKAVGANEAWFFTDNGTIFKYNDSVRSPLGMVPVQAGYASVDITGKPGTWGTFSVYAVMTSGILSNVWGRVPTLNNISPSTNIHLNGGEVAVADMDGNGTVDLFISSDGRFPDRLYANRGDAFFQEVTDRLHPPGRSVASRPAIADLDNNGLPDIVALRGTAQTLWYRNMGDWQFEERTGPIALTGVSNYSRLQAADMDNDGDLDLVMMPAVHDRGDISLVVYFNSGVGTFPDSTLLSFPGSPGASHLIFLLSDLNGDHLTDIFKPNIGERAEFYRNAGGGRFVEAAEECGLTCATDGMDPFVTAALATDLNRDCSMDLLVVQKSGVARTLLNNSKGHFRIDQTISFDAQGENPWATFTDIDCDGDQDLFLYDRFYEQRDGRFSVFTTLGFRMAGSIVCADLDGDGDGDVIAQSLKTEQPLTVFENSLHPGNIIMLSVKGVRDNSFGIGSEVRLWKRTPGPGRSLILFQRVVSPAPLCLAMDTSGIVDLEVRFPDGTTVVREAVRPGRMTIAQAGGIAGLFWDACYSLRRSVRMADFPLEAGKIAIVLAILSIAVLLASRKFLVPLRANLAFVIVTIIAYLLAVHATIRHGNTVAMIYPVGGVLVTSALWIGVRGSIERRRRARRISHYELRHQLGEGGMGTVFSAIDTSTGNTVAIKMLHPSLMSDEENRKRLMAEGLLLSSLRHPNIISMLEVGEHLGQGFIAMEYLPGGTLQRACADRSLTLRDVRRIALEICSGLEEIHRHGVIHRDLKSGNIMFAGDGSIRIMDFGLSRSPLVTTMTSLGTILGTLGYVSPEQVTNMQVDHRTDIFSFGVLLYEMLTGRLPFAGENEMAVIHAIFNVHPPPPSTLNSNVPPEVDAVVLRCINKTASDRYQSAGELRIDLEKDYW